jgi:DNA-binding NtrC family response regulator
MTDRTPYGVRAERILVVDDEEPIRDTIISMLVVARYECRGAAGGVEARALLESGKEFDLMLSDLMMADLDGIGLLRCTTDLYPDMPVVMVTAVLDLSLGLATMRNGAFDCLLKPFGREELLSAVRRALENRHYRVEHRAYVSNLESQVASLTEQLHGRKTSRGFCNSL